MSGLYAALIGLFLIITYRNYMVRLAATLSIFAGFVVIYLSLVKAILLTLMASAAAFVFVSAWRNLMLLDRSRRARISVIVPAATAVIALVVGFSWATGLGGRPVTKAITGLTSKSAGNGYYSERGSQMEYAINNYLPEYPLGAGLGRFGMMCYYFGYPDDPDSPTLWAEIQWPAWLLDGGVALLIAYPVAILIAIWWALRLSLNSLSLELGSFAIFVFAYDIGTLAMTFDYSFFLSQDGIVFWLLNAMLFNAAISLAKTAREARPVATTRMRYG